MTWIYIAGAEQCCMGLGLPWEDGVQQKKQKIDFEMDLLEYTGINNAGKWKDKTKADWLLGLLINIYFILDKYCSYQQNFNPSDRP